MLRISLISSVLLVAASSSSSSSSVFALTLMVNEPKTVSTLTSSVIDPSIVIEKVLDASTTAIKERSSYNPCCDLYPMCSCPKFSDDNAPAPAPLRRRRQQAITAKSLKNINNVVMMMPSAHHRRHRHPAIVATHNHKKNGNTFGEQVLMTMTPPTATKVSHNNMCCADFPLCSCPKF